MNLRFVQRVNAITPYAGMWRDGRSEQRSGAVFVSGLNGLATHLYLRPAGSTDQLDLTLPTIEAGYTALSPPSGANWGNSTSVQMVSDLIDWGIANIGWPDGPVHYYGTSHGGLIGLKCLMNSTVAQKIRSMVVAIAPVDIQAIYNENRSGLAASISTAYGGAPPDAENPADRPEVVRASGVPVLQIYGGADTIGLASEAAAFAERAETTTHYMGGAIGHSLSFRYSRISEWFEAHEDTRWAR